MHRCGRTARQSKAGQSFLLLGAEDFNDFTKISKSIGSKAKPMTIPKRKIEKFVDKSLVVSNYVKLKKAIMRAEDGLSAAKSVNNMSEYESTKARLQELQRELDATSKRLDLLVRN